MHQSVVENPVCHVTLHFRDRSGACAVFFRYRNRAEIIVLICDQKPYQVWFSCQRKSSPVKSEHSLISLGWNIKKEEQKSGNVTQRLWNIDPFLLFVSSSAKISQVKGTFCTFEIYWRQIVKCLWYIYYSYDCWERLLRSPRIFVLSSKYLNWEKRSEKEFKDTLVLLLTGPRTTMRMLAIQNKILGLVLIRAKRLFFAPV